MQFYVNFFAFFDHATQSMQLLLPLFDNFIALNGTGILESMLEPHMKNTAGASQSEVGMAFLIFGGSFLVSSLVAGCVSAMDL